MVRVTEGTLGAHLSLGSRFSTLDSSIPISRSLPPFPFSTLKPRDLPLPSLGTLAGIGKVGGGGTAVPEGRNRAAGALPASLPSPYTHLPCFHSAHHRDNGPWDGRRRLLPGPSASQAASVSPSAAPPLDSHTSSASHPHPGTGYVKGPFPQLRRWPTKPSCLLPPIGARGSQLRFCCWDCWSHIFTAQSSRTLSTGDRCPEIS